MEYFRKIRQEELYPGPKSVLILVVMENFRKRLKTKISTKMIGLNPCCNGKLSKVPAAKDIEEAVLS